LALRAVASRCELALAQQDAELYYVENARFHQLIYDASGNDFLAEQTRHLQRRLKAYRRLQLNQRGRLAQSMQEHAEILGLLEARQPQRVAEVMRQHIRIQEHTYEDFLNNRRTLRRA
ncbi:FCD domain-containing protein, partial [Thioclava sp. BHET1]